MKILILGGNGLIGRQCARFCREHGFGYTATYHARPGAGLIPFDVLDSASFTAIFERIAPDAILNCIGLAGGVDYCERNPQIGRRYHVTATAAMVEWCRSSGAAFAYISSDYVFDGSQPLYRETDQTRPLNLYGRLKLEAETIIRDRLTRYVIARTTNVFGWDPETATPNFLMHLYRTLQSQDRAAVPAFLSGNPTYAADLAAGIVDLIARGQFGLFHIVGPSFINRYEWAQKFLRAVAWPGKSIDKLTAPPAGMVPRPLAANLDTSAFHAVSRVVMHDVDAGINLFVAAMRAANERRASEGLS